MAIVELKCDKCGKVVQFLVPNEKVEQICECGGLLKKIFPKGIFRI